MSEITSSMIDDREKPFIYHQLISFIRSFSFFFLWSECSQASYSNQMLGVVLKRASYFNRSAINHHHPGCPMDSQHLTFR